MLAQPVAPSLDLAHCQLMPVTVPSGSVSVAVIRPPMLPLVGDSVASPISSTLNTVTVTWSSSCSFPERAVTVISYVLSLFESAGASKFGVDLKVSTPLLLMEKSEASVPLSLQLTLPALGPAAV